MRSAPAPHKQSLFARLVRFMGRRMFGKDLAPARVMGDHDAVLLGTSAMELSLRRGGRVPARIKSLAEVQAARLIGCSFCIDIGSFVGRGHGVSEAQLRALDDFEKSPLFDDRERLALRLAEAMTLRPDEAHDLVAEARAAFGDAGAVELVAQIAWENFRARFNHAYGLRSAGFLPEGACPLPARAPAPAVAG